MLWEVGGRPFLMKGSETQQHNDCHHFWFLEIQQRVLPLYRKPPKKKHDMVTRKISSHLPQPRAVRSLYETHAVRAKLCANQQNLFDI